MALQCSEAPSGALVETFENVKRCVIYLPFQAIILFLTVALDMSNYFLRIFKLKIVFISAVYVVDSFSRTEFGIVHKINMLQLLCCFLCYVDS